MKRIYWLAAIGAVLTLGSCSNDQELDNPQTTNNKEIGFRSFIDKGANSRATVTTGSNILGFTVTGWWDKNNEIGKAKTANPTFTDAEVVAEAIKKASTAGDEYMFNAFDITHREAGIGSWSYTPLRYWPAAEIIGGGVTFFAYSPASSKNVAKETGSGTGVYTGGLLNYKGGTIKYTVPNPIKQDEIKETPQEDFLLARTDPMTSGKVELNFAHALSRVKFYAKTTKPNLTYVIGGVEMLGLTMDGEIELKDIPLDGKFTYDDSNQASTPVTLWKLATTDAKVGRMVLDLGESPINLLSEYKSLHGESGALMVMPQTTILGTPTDLPAQEVDKTLADQYKKFLIRVRYKAYLNNPDGTYYAGDKDWYEDAYFEVTDKLRSKDKTIVPFTFEIGRQYNFYFEFGSEVGDGIKFNVGVGSWSDTPEEYLPQLDFWNTSDNSKSLISAKLAEKANPGKYTAEGVTLNQILAVTNMTLYPESDDDLKGLEYFNELTYFSINLQDESTVITSLNTGFAPKLNSLGFYGAPNATIKTVDISGNSNIKTISMGAYKTVNYTTTYGTTNVGTLIIPAGYTSVNNWKSGMNFSPSSDGTNYSSITIGNVKSGTANLGAVTISKQ